MDPELRKENYGVVVIGLLLLMSASISSVMFCTFGSPSSGHGLSISLIMASSVFGRHANGCQTLSRKIHEIMAPPKTLFINLFLHDADKILSVNYFCST
jgi:hypothetical protein